MKSSATSTTRRTNTDYKKLVESLEKMLPPKIPYGELVGAPWPYTGQGKMVYEDPEPYFIEQAITAITDLLARVESAEARAERAERERDIYLEWLNTVRPCQFCHHILPDPTPECEECGRCRTKYKPKFVLRDLDKE